MPLLASFDLLAVHERSIRTVRHGAPCARCNQECQDEIRRALLATRNNQGLLFNIALNYGARAEMVEAIKKIVDKVISGEIPRDSICEATVSSFLYTGGVPDPDLLIRTAGELRLSNFLLWQLAYTELWVTERLWPDFTREDLIVAIQDYQQRDRRFGALTALEKGDENVLHCARCG